jgi:hypothetical protein
MHSNYENLILNENDNHLIDEIISRSYIDELYYVCIRTCRNTIRDPAMAASQIIIATLFALLTGLVFNQIQATVEKGVQNRLGVIFFIIINQIYSTVTALEPLVQERALFIHVKIFPEKNFAFKLFYFIQRKMRVDIIEYRHFLLQN